MYGFLELQGHDLSWLYLDCVVGDEPLISLLFFSLTYVFVSLLPVSGLPLLPPIGALHTLHSPVSYVRPHYKIR